MARHRPAYRLPLVNMPKRAGAGFEAMIAKRTPFNDFSEGSGRRQCVAIARVTNRQCGCNAINGSDYCWHHKGRLDLDRLVKERSPKAAVWVKDGTLARRYYANIAFSEECGIEIPKHVRQSVQNERVGARGRKYEAWLNKRKD